MLSSETSDVPMGSRPLSRTIAAFLVTCGRARTWDGLVLALAMLGD